jgi:phage-related protein
MPKREVLYKGRFYTVELAITASGRCPGKKFLDSLSKLDKGKILRIIKRLADADEGKLANREQFKKIEGEEFFEFKNFQIRMPCYLHSDRRVVITHGFPKKGDSIPAEQINRMKRIRDEYEKRT